MLSKVASVEIEKPVVNDEAHEEAQAEREAPFSDFFFTSSDGLKLHARDYGPRNSKLTPVLCLPGLTRGVRDFHNLALRLSSTAKRRRRVVVAEFRGRGQSDYDKDISNYTPKREAIDTLDLMAAIGLEHAVAIGTSRGGLVAMAMSALRPAVLKGFVLNDIGPRIEGIGLLRLAGQLSRLPVPASWDEAAETLQKLHGEAFQGLTNDDWMAFAREIYRDNKGKPARDFDQKIAKTLDADAIAAGDTPEIWPLFMGLSNLPGLVVRGENSDLLSAATVAEMQSRHRRLSTVTVANRGHAPFLVEPEAFKGITGLLGRIDAS